MIQVHQFHVLCAARDHAAHFIEHKQTPAETDPRAQCHEGVHIRCAMSKRTKTAGKKLPVDYHDNQGNQHLCQRQGEMIVLEVGWERPVQHVMAHCDVHQNDQKPDRENQSPLQLRCFAVFQCIFFRRKGSAGSTLPSIIRALWRRTVACIFHSTDDFLCTGCSLHTHGIGQQTNAAGGNSRHFGNCLLHSGLACGTAHSGYDILFHVQTSFNRHLMFY